MSDALMSSVVRLRPDIKEFVKELKTGVEKASKDAGASLEKEMTDSGRDAGREAGDQLEKGIKEGVTAGAKKGGEQLKKETEAAAKAASNQAQKLSSWGNKLSLGITAPVLLGVHKANAAFEQFQDDTSAMGVFYGEQAQQIQNWADTSARAYHMSRLAAIQMANGYAPLLQQFVATQDQGAAATEAIARTADMASFFGGSIEEAQAAVQSFLSGSSVEPIRRYGVFASETAVKLQAIKMGLVQANVSQTDVAISASKVADAQAKAAKAYKEHGGASKEYADALLDVQKAEENATKALQGKLPELTDAQKMQARYAILLEQTSKAEGDAARTAESAANKHKDMTAAMQDSAVAAGQSLEPAMKKVYEAAASIADVFNSMPQGAQTFLVTAALVGAAIGPLLKMVSAVMSLRAAYLSAAAARMALNTAEGVGGVGGVGMAGGKLGSGLLKAGGVLLGGALVAKGVMGSMDDGNMTAGDIASTTAGGAMIGASFGGAPGALVGAAGGFAYGVGNKLYSHMPWAMATGGTVYPDGRIVHLAEGGQPEDVVPHSKRRAYASGVLGADGDITALALAVQTLAEQPRNIYVTVDGKGFDEASLARHIDGLSRDSAAKKGRSRRTPK